MKLNKWEYESPLGIMVILSDDENLKGLWFHNQKHIEKNWNLTNIETKQNKINKLVVDWLDKYFKGEKPNPELIPLDIETTAYRNKVFNQLKKIPYGSVSTYKQIFEQMNKDKLEITGSSRAVGGAVGHNPIVIIIPCHRVIGTDESLTGYVAGIERKIELLKLEDVNLKKNSQLK